jgi:hypothetical protein
MVWTDAGASYIAIQESIKAKIAAKEPTHTLKCFEKLMNGY